MTARIDSTTEIICRQPYLYYGPSDRSVLPSWFCTLLANYLADDCSRSWPGIEID